MKKLHIKLLLSVALLASLAVSCDKESNVDNSEEYNYNVSIKNGDEVGCSAGLTTIYITGREGDSWYAQIDNGDDTWCAFDQNITTVIKRGEIYEGLNALFLYYSANDSVNNRAAKITITFGSGDVKEVELKQLTEDKYSGYLFSELPKYIDGKNLSYATHYTKTVSGEAVRNFTFCFDKERRTSLWVAYPLHDIYIVGTGERTNSWDFDPTISSLLQQQVKSKSYKDDNDEFHKGHQLPSADRLANDEMNEQTFYLTNVTPQNGSLNMGLWETFEERVRDFRCADTLYVVTGPYYDPNAEPRYAKDNKDNLIPVPTHYFKALLRTKSGKSSKSVKECSAEELKSICFWIENKKPTTSKISADMFKSVDQVEALIGFDLFPEVKSLDETSCVFSDWISNTETE